MANGNGDHPIQGLMNVTLERIREMVDSNTIIGNPITTADGTTILPVSKVTFGFTSGGSDFVSSKAPKDLFGGGSGAGVSITPVAFLVLHGGSVRMIQLADKNGGTLDRALNMLPEVIDKVQGLVSKDKGGKQKAPPPAPEVTVEVEGDAIVIEAEPEEP
ncbi:GerW family sporulation protein [Ruminococcaceae bacterium OttesenSCG-928-D13]|nr:GerW family sporulation protein [Ruminococcaceae bacterium OttesenSCG-928-D13]